MLERDLIVPNRLGLHARAAAKLVGVLSRFQSHVFMTCRGREINAKSIMGVMMLAASQGTPVRVRIDGADKEAAFDALEDLFNRRFDEDA